jgi:glycosyltransferase involved in cell wall biosynthesis
MSTSTESIVEHDEPQARAVRGEPAAARRKPAVVLLVSQLGVGGAERHMVTLANRLSDSFEVVFVYIKRDETLLHQVQQERLADLQCLDVDRGIRLHAARRLAALVDRHGADLVLCANSYPMAYAQLARMYTKQALRVVEVYHTTLLETRGGHLVMALVYRNLLKLASTVVFVCDAQRAYWEARGFVTRRVCRIYNGVDTRHFDPALFVDGIAETRRRHGFESDDRVVGICAVLRPEKAHGDLLRAVAAAATAGQRWKVLIVGDGPQRASIERLIDELGLRDSVRITGYLSDVRAAVAACDAVALVSTAVETFSIAALEAMAMGKPIVMSDIGGAREQIVPGENGWLFPAGDVKALTACLIDAYDPGRLRAMGSAARERTRRLFSLDRMIAEYVQLVETVRRDG